MRKAVVIFASLVLLVLVNVGIYGREQLLRDGRVVLLELAPVDPRSLMQGDYMALRFQIANEAFSRNDTKNLQDGRIVAAVDARGIASFRRFADESPLAAGEVLLRYRIRNGSPKFATNAFFFQEGHAEVYAKARYGEFRVGSDGNMILMAMRDADLKPLGPSAGAASGSGQ